MDFLKLLTAGADPTGGALSGLAGLGGGGGLFSQSQNVTQNSTNQSVTNLVLSNSNGAGEVDTSTYGGVSPVQSPLNTTDNRSNTLPKGNSLSEENQERSSFVSTYTARLNPTLNNQADNKWLWVGAVGVLALVVGAVFGKKANKKKRK